MNRKDVWMQPLWLFLAQAMFISLLVSDGLGLGGRGMVSMVSAGLDLDGWISGVHGVCWFGLEWSGLWCPWCLLVSGWSGDGAYGVCWLGPGWLGIFVV